MSPKEYKSLHDETRHWADRRCFLKQASLMIAGAQAGAILPWIFDDACASAPSQGGKRPAKGFVIVETAYGKVRGTISEEIKVFKAIPYGGTTTGKNRFMPPTKPTPWTGVRDALEYGPNAPQRDPNDPDASRRAPTVPLIGAMSDHPESEDCLVLNVWTPGLRDGRRRPVMFWCHGGGFSTGSGSSRGYDGTNLCRRGDVVVVTVNHRLNVLGFAHLADLGGDEFAQSGNVGMLDIVQALGWVRENIAEFGGDPNRVLIFGESGGGRKVAVLLAMPSAKGLFHRAAIQSGPGIRMVARERANKASEMLLAELGLGKAQVHQLQTLPLDRIMVAYHAVTKKLGTGVISGFAPVVDGAVLPHHPFDPVAPSVSADVPLIIGSNRTEMTLFSLGDPSTFTLDEAGLKQRVGRLVGDSVERAIDVYRKANPVATPSDLYFLIFSDFQYGAATAKLAERKAALGRAPAYLYKFAWETPVMDGKLKSPHALEIAFVFDNVKVSARYTGGGPDAGALADKMSDAWIAFARTGNPNTPKLPRWPAYNAVERATMIFNNECKVENDPGREQRLVMEGVLKLS
jgi:para-nitrobenzyl esterase